MKAIKEKRLRDWGAEAQLVALHETHGLSGEALHVWCREKGLFAHYLTSWKAAFFAGAAAGTSGTRDWRALKDQNEQLKRELLRKDKALAEAAALLVLQKKFRALWENEARTGLPQRGEIITLVSDAIESGARQDRACAAICLSERTLQRWQHGARRCDQQPIKVQTPKNKLSTVEREHLLAAANSEAFGYLPPGPIVPSALAPLVRYVNLTLPA